MATSASVDSSLWWDSFSILLLDLENASISPETSSNLVKKLNDNHAWLLGLVDLFKHPNQKSKEALNSQQVNVGSHQLTIQPQTKDAALEISSYLYLDEVQSYILVIRFLEQNNVEFDFAVRGSLHLILLQYYIERQCLLKCSRQILMHALYYGVGSSEEGSMQDEVLKLVSDGMESKLLSVLQTLISSNHPDLMDVELFTLWAEETLIEENLVLEILFLAYYESFCTCNGEQWRKLCTLYKEIIFESFNFSKLVVSSEAMQLIYHLKIQMLLILIGTLNLENLIQMLHDEIPFRQGSFVFSMTDIQEMDALISSFNVFEMKEFGPLILSWAVFLCLLSSLPRIPENNGIMEIDHVSYVRQAFEASSLSCFLEILQSDVLNGLDGPVAGYRSVMRTFVSAFIASYEISIQPEDTTFMLILDILCKIYSGEETLCDQFWDRNSIVDGPIRCFLCSLERDFPFMVVEFVSLLSALSEGSWPAECVYNFLDKSVGISSLFEIGSNTFVDENSQIVETRFPLQVPGVEGLNVPSQTRGTIVRIIDENVALVRWEYTQSGVRVLLLRLAQDLYVDRNDEVLATLGLFCRLVSFHMAVCFSLINLDNSLKVNANQINDQLMPSMRVDVVQIICMLIRNLSPICCGSAVMLSMCVNILAKMMTCSPSLVTAVILKSNIFETGPTNSSFGVGYNVSTSNSWLLSGRLAKLLLIDCEQNDNSYPLTISVLEFTMKLLETDIENDILLALVILSLQYILVNHEYWKFKARNVRWKVTLKVLEVIKKCIIAIVHFPKQGQVIRDILFSDSSIHSTLFRIICTTTQTLEKLFISRLNESVEIEGLQMAICSVLDIIFNMLSNIPVDLSSSLPAFHQSILSSMIRPIPVITAVISLVSYFRNPAIQLNAARVLTIVFMLADRSQHYLCGNASFVLDDNQIKDLRYSINEILCEEHSLLNEDRFVSVIKLLTSAARYQPAFLISVIATEEDRDIQLANNSNVETPSKEISFGQPGSKNASLLYEIQKYVERSDLIKSNPHILLNVLNFLKALWQGAVHYKAILLMLKSSGNFWKQLSNYISLEAVTLEGLNETETLNLAYRYRCRSVVLEIMTYDLFLHKKQQHAESIMNPTIEFSKNVIKNASSEQLKSVTMGDLKGILSSWCENFVLGNLIKSYATWDYNNEIYLRAKVAASLFSVHVMCKFINGDMGSLSVLLIKKIRLVFEKLSDLPTFFELIAQYSQRGYSKGGALNALVLSDLFYHLEGKLEGREIEIGPFKELSQYLLESKFFQSYKQKHDGDLFALSQDVYLFETKHLRSDIGLDMWNHSEWKEYKSLADTLLLCMQDTNSMMMVSNSKLSALKALTNMLNVFKDDLAEKNASSGGKFFEKLTLPSINCVCLCLQNTIESFASAPVASEDILYFVEAQAELLLHLVKFIDKSLSMPTCVLVLKTLDSVLKVLGDLNPTVSEAKSAIQLLLTLLLFSIESCCLNTQNVGVQETESVKISAEVSNVSLGILPILCKYIETPEHCTFSVATIDSILIFFSNYNTWFLVLQKHLPLKHLILKLQDKNTPNDAIPVILKFLLTLARVRGGAEMILTTGFFQSLKVLFADLSEKSVSNPSGQIEKHQYTWGLGLSVVTALIHSLGDAACTFITNSVIPYFFSEKVYVMSYYLTAPDYPSDSDSRKRARPHRNQISLSFLKETEHTVMLICALAKHQGLSAKTLKGMDSQLREKSIHLLAFIVRGIQSHVESTTGLQQFLFCPPVLKDEFDCSAKSSFVNVKSGWFALSPLRRVSKPRIGGFSINMLALNGKNQESENTNLDSQTYFSDTVAIQIYRITFLILKFLCLQAEGAVKKFEDVGFVDVAHFPELPMPEILHGLQVQASAIVTELCDGEKSKPMKSEIQNVCLLLVRIMEMSLYLEFCVSHVCEIRPAIGRVEDFTKKLKLLLKGTKTHEFLNLPMKSLKQIVSVMYPGVL